MWSEINNTVNAQYKQCARLTTMCATKQTAQMQCAQIQCAQWRFSRIQYSQKVTTQGY